MLIGAAGTIIMNVLFGVASFWGLLGLFVAIRGVDDYMQAFGGPGMVKVNDAWFRCNERGRFAGIFGFMINRGRVGIFTLGPALLAGFLFLGLWRIPPLHWRWLFWIPAGLTTLVALAMAAIVKDTPEQAGFPAVNQEEGTSGGLSPAPTPARARCGRGSISGFRASCRRRTRWIIRPPNFSSLAS